MVASHEDDRSRVRVGRDAEAVVLALYDERRDLDSVELGQAARRGGGGPRPPWRAQWEREAENTGRCEHIGGSTGNPRAGRSASDDVPLPGECTAPQRLDHCRPRGIELMRRRGRATAGDAIGLFHERHPDLPGERGSRRGDEIRRANAAARAVPENHRTPCIRHGVEMHPRDPVRRFDLERRLLRDSHRQ